MNYSSAKFNAILSPNMDTDNIFPIYCEFCTEFDYFASK